MYNDFLESILDFLFYNDQGYAIRYQIPDNTDGMLLSRYDITAVYLLIEILYNKGGWLQERPSNRRRVGRKGLIGESTDIQISRIGTKHDPKWSRFSLDQKVLYFILLKRWGLLDEEV